MLVRLSNSVFGMFLFVLFVSFLGSVKVSNNCEYSVHVYGVDGKTRLRVLTPEEMSMVAGGGWKGRADAIGGAFAGGAIGGYSSGLNTTQSIGVGIGAAIGTGTSGASSGRVICTHFYRKGMIDSSVWRADIEFTAKRLSATTVRGYQYWAIPYVRLMRKSPLAEKLMFPLALWRAQELAFKMGQRPRGSYRGKLVRLVGETVCFLIGCCVHQKDWRTLWQDGSAMCQSQGN